MRSMDDRNYPIQEASPRQPKVDSNWSQRLRHPACRYRSGTNLHGDRSTCHRPYSRASGAGWPSLRRSAGSVGFKREISISSQIRDILYPRTHISFFPQYPQKHIGALLYPFVRRRICPGDFHQPAFRWGVHKRV